MEQSKEIAKVIYNYTLDWYKSADTKAQMMLTLLGSFIVFSTGIVLANPDNLQKTVQHFKWPAWVMLAFAAAAVAMGIYSAFMCLYSRILKFEAKPADALSENYPDSEMLFFGFHASHHPAELFQSLKGLNDERQIRMYSSQITELAKNVLEKHRYVNRAFLSVFISACSMLLATVFYLINL